MMRSKYQITFSEKKNILLPIELTLNIFLLFCVIEFSLLVTDVILVSNDY